MPRRNDMKDSEEQEPLPAIDPSILSSLINQGNATMCSEEDLRLLMEDDEKDRKKRRRRGGGGGSRQAATSSKEEKQPQGESEGHVSPNTVSSSAGSSTSRRSNKVKKHPQSSSSDRPTCPVLVRDDPRVHYPRHLIRAFNSCDPRFLQETLEKYCEPSVLGIYRHIGPHNPFGVVYRECDGIDGNMTLWTSLFQSTPDFIFRLLDLQVTVDQESSCCIVSSSFDMHGTRIRDIKHVQEDDEGQTHSNQTSASREESSYEDAIDSASQEGTGSGRNSWEAENNNNVDIYSLDRESLLRLPQTTPEIVDLLCLYEIEDFMREEGWEASSSQDSDLASVEQRGGVLSEKGPSAAECGGDGVDVQNLVSIFSSASLQHITKHVKLVVAHQPLRESISVKYSGTFTVYINAEDKVFKFEFFYKVEEGVAKKTQSAAISK